MKALGPKCAVGTASLLQNNFMLLLLCIHVLVHASKRLFLYMNFHYYSLLMFKTNTLVNYVGHL